MTQMKYALTHGATVIFQERRRVDQQREAKFTNGYTVRALFPNENPVIALKRELKSLSCEEYMRTVKDIRFPQRSDWREFGKTYNDTEEIYIKVRVELFDSKLAGRHTTFVMSFHYAVVPFSQETFPYKHSF